MDSVRELDTRRELEERSDTFFDEKDEERILAEVQRRHQGEQQNAHGGYGGGMGLDAQASAPMSSFGKLPDMVSTEQFMKDMGVMNTDQLRDGSAKDAGPGNFDGNRGTMQQIRRGQQSTG